MVSNNDMANTDYCCNDNTECDCLPGSDFVDHSQMEQATVATEWDELVTKVEYLYTMAKRLEHLLNELEPTAKPLLEKVANNPMMRMFL